MGWHLRTRASRRRLALPEGAAFWSVAAAFIVMMLGTTLPTPLYVLYQADFGFSTLMVTVVFATYAVGVVAALLFYGDVSDVVGRRRVLLGGCALSLTGSAVFLLAQDLGMLFLGRVLSGLSAGLVTGTATAAIVDLRGTRRTSRASLVATVAQMGGLGAGPLLAGVLAASAPEPLRLPYAVHLTLLLLTGLGVWFMPEPVAPVRRWAPPRRTRPTVPRAMRGVFVRSAVAGFAGFAVLGLFTAVAPTFLRELLGVRSPSVVGGVVCAVFAASTVGQVGLVPVLGRRAVPVGCGGLIVGMAVLTGGFLAESLGALLAGGLLAGLGQGVSFRAGLADVNAAAPAAHRADVASSFFTVLYVALAVPVVGVGLLAGLVGIRTAGVAFSLAVALLAGWALVAVLRSRAPGPDGA
ncbi:hypothetical protein N566_10220 [Streptomycetaceae bacterium MP113-05]|nr:hypothetical protein N566_10220 [Streptomycetaceae bacterium MP113-05]